jgi:hypothetical protein
MDSFTTAWGIFAEIFVWGICWINIFLQKLVLFDVLINFLVLLDKFAALNSHKSHKFPKCFGKKYFPRFFFCLLYLTRGTRGFSIKKILKGSVRYVGILQLPIMDFNLINFTAVD